jgi:dTDP-3-amino-3,4,6-trideoxy-alpha-D-glucose transaminase
LGDGRVKVPFLDLTRAIAELRGELDAAIGRVLDAGRFVGGVPVESFEAAFAAFCGARHAVAVASGTDALALALRAAGVGEGDEVVTAANTCVPTVAGIEAAHAIPVLADVDEESFTLDPRSVEAALSPSTRAIVAVHLYGQCADVDALHELAAARGIPVVEDAAQAHGAELDGRRAGTLGRAAAFSFYPTKNLGALGDGGAVVTDDDDVAERVRMLRSYGERRRYESIAHGRNSRLDTLQAAVLGVRLPHLDAWNDRRRSLAQVYDDALGATELTPPRELPRRRHAYHLYVVRSRRRDELRASLGARGIETLVHYPRPVHLHPAYRELGHGRDLRVSERLAGEVLSLPLYPQLTDDEAATVAAAAAS